ncbi:hypothetical protein PoB_003114600 [Plakobranchus ocellatus]|uniref:Uncharacterized protein n=1 Tax=Plakobranchus ocellatus TaxID=259542 RepID=A0AAV4A8N1_9GAST|nr:hypothetical protein PoB_003114600 [Plakobranchus ocellatus]
MNENYDNNNNNNDSNNNTINNKNSTTTTSTTTKAVTTTVLTSTTTIIVHIKMRVPELIRGTTLRLHGSRVSFTPTKGVNASRNASLTCVSCPGSGQSGATSRSMLYTKMKELDFCYKIYFVP